MFANKRGLKMLTVCPKCGSKFSETVQFCDKCGYNIEKDKALNEQKNSSSVKTTDASAHALNNKLQGYIQIIAVIEVAFGLFGVVMSALLGIIAPFVPEMIKSSQSASEGVVYSDKMLQFFTVLLIVIAVMILVISALAVFVGYKLYHLENIGRFGTMIFASFALLMVPFGTIYGIISLVLLSKPETIELLRDRNKYL